MWQSRLQELDRIAKEENLNIATEKLTVAEPAAVTGVPQDAGLVAQIPIPACSRVVLPSSQKAACAWSRNWPSSMPNPQP